MYEAGRGRIFGCCFVTCLTLLILGTGCRILQAQEVPQPEPQVASNPRLLTGADLRIHHGSVDRNRSISSIRIDLGMLDLTPDVRVTWNPREATQDLSLTCQITGNTLTVGTEDSSDVKLVYEPNPITKDTPAILNLEVQHPDRILPGVYTGNAVFQFKGNPDKFNAIVPALWPIRVVVSGRILKVDSVTFKHAENGRLHVGQPATVIVRMDTIGCEPGEGTLKLRFTPLGGQPRPLLTMPVSFEGKIRDPLTELKDPEYVCPEWRNAAINNIVPKPTDKAGDADHREYVMEFQSGDCFLPGKAEAEVAWPQATEAPATAPKGFTQSCSAEIGGGVTVFPRLAFDSEIVHLRVVSRNNLGPKCDLVLINKDSVPVTVSLYPFIASDNQNASNEVVYQYYTGIKPQELGPWQVTWPESAKEIAGEAAQSAGFTVWGKLVNRLEESRVPGEPRVPIRLRVFASETPVLWDQIYGEDEGRGYYQFRLDAFEMGISTQYARNGRLRPVSIYCGIPEQPDEMFRWNPEQHPYLMISPESDRLQASPEGPDNGRAGGFGSMEARPPNDTSNNSDGATPAFSRELDVAFPEEGLLAFNVYCATTPVVGEHRRKMVMDHDFVYRAIITGTDGAGLPIARIVELPFLVEVTDHWVYYQKWFVWIGLGIAGITVLSLLWWYGNREPGSKSLAVAGGGQSMADDFPELLGASSASESVNDRGLAAGVSRKSEPRQDNETLGSDSPATAPVPPSRSLPAEIDKDLMDGFL